MNEGEWEGGQESADGVEASSTTTNSNNTRHLLNSGGPDDEVEKVEEEGEREESSQGDLSLSLSHTPMLLVRQFAKTAKHTFHPSIHLEASSGEQESVSVGVVFL